VLSPVPEQLRKLTPKGLSSPGLARNPFQRDLLQDTWQGFLVVFHLPVQVKT